MTTSVSKALSPPIPVPTHGSGGTFSVLVRCIASASPEALLNAVRDVSTWPEWNTFCPEGKIASSSGDGGEQSNKTPELGKGDRPGWLETGSQCDILVYMSGDKNSGGSRRQEIRVTGIWRLEDCDEIALPEELFSPEHSSTTVFASASSNRERRGFRIAWVACGWSDWQMRSERVMDFEEVPGEKEGEVATLYTCWETFGGLLGVAVKLAVGTTLVERFGDYGKDLKGFVERNSGSTGEGHE
ncbi:hypothetical protein B7463_g6867, partial [Scytalidium lignicola]